MAIIGKIRKHSGLAVIIVGVAIAAFVIGNFGKKRARGTTDIGSVSGEIMPYSDFTSKVEQTVENQKKNSGNDKITDDETFNIRQTVWNDMVKDLIMNKEYDDLGLTVSPEELFDQVQGKNPHRYILQYFKDPKTGAYDPAMVLNYLKNLDQMDPKDKQRWLEFEKAIKTDRMNMKFNNLIAKAYYVPKAFLKRDYLDQNTSLKVRSLSPPFTTIIPDNSVKLTDADYQKYYDENRPYFFADQATRDLDFVVFEVVPSDIDRKKTAADVAALYKDFQISTDLPTFASANSDKKYDSTYMKKGMLPGILDSVAYKLPVGTFIPPFEFNNAWYMAKIQNIMDRPDTVKATQILISFAGSPLKNDAIKRTKEQAKKKADSILTILKAHPDAFRQAAVAVSDYPTAKEDGGELKPIIDGDPAFALFFTSALPMKVNELKVIENSLGYSIFKPTYKSKPVTKAKVVLVQRNIEPSNQTFQDTYLKASAFAGQNKTPEAFDKSATSKNLNKRSAQSVREMDNFLMGMPSAREIVRWAYSEGIKVGEVSPVFDLSGKYVVAILKNMTEKGEQTLDKIKDRIEPNVRNQKKIEMMAEQMSKAAATNKDINALALQFKGTIDTVNVNYAPAYTRSQISREYSLFGQLYALPKGVLSGPLVGKYGAYYVVVDDIVPAVPTEDYRNLKAQKEGGFMGRVNSNLFEAIKKTADIKDNRLRFY